MTEGLRKKLKLFYPPPLGVMAYFKKSSFVLVAHLQHLLPWLRV